ncbi:MAG TPA: transglutaminase-like domain-containing protein [Kiritimatiellia bacterium]|nr:transglutaminase-like domain-containing protein [Kiritimatiellia bacterium]
MSVNPDNVKNLPHILRLLDDESPIVRTAITRQLTEFGVGLEPLLDRLPAPPTQHQRHLIRNLLAPLRRDALKQAWTQTLTINSDFDLIEAAYQALADFFNPPSDAPPLPQLLDQLAQQYRPLPDQSQPASLAHFIFKTAGFRGAYADYYRPENSDLVHVIHHRRGIPLSLATLLMLVGRRLGITMDGANFPGHYLARFRIRRDLYFIDGFDGGKILTEADLIAMHGEAIRPTLRAKFNGRVILDRILRNLNQAYRKLDQLEDADLINDLISLTRSPNHGVSP